MSWKKQDKRSRKLSGLIANNCEYDNVAVIELHTNVNGSGDKAFGGAKSWPVLTLKVGFQAGEEELRNQLAEKLEKVTQEFLEEVRK